MTTILEESGLRFTFQGNAVKFDDTPYCKNVFGSGKSVDFIVLSPARLQMIEVKNCRGREMENLPRLIPGNNYWNPKRKPLIPFEESGKGKKRKKEKDSFDIEVVKKVKSTLACLYGAWSQARQTRDEEKAERARELLEWWESFRNPKIQDTKPSLQIILFLEGDFDSLPKELLTPKKGIMLDLANSLKTRLGWLNCESVVINSAMCAGRNTGFQVTTI